jgi:hypothetical protein
MIRKIFYTICLPFRELKPHTIFVKNPFIKSFTLKEDLWKENKEETSTYLNQLNLPDDGRKEFITSKVEDFNTIEDKLNTLLPLLKNAKKETMDAYKKDPDFKVMYGTQFANTYLDKLITLFTNKQQ